MASRTAILAIRVISETKDAEKGLDRTSQKVGKFQQGMEKATVPAAAAGAAALAFAAKTGQMASIAQQNAGAVESVFKSQADAVKAFSQSAAQNLGISASSYQELAAVIGSQLKNMGVPMEQVAGQTNGLIEKGADLAAMFGGTTADAVAALSSLLRGERDPIERYGVSINDAAIQAQKAKMGLSGLNGEADKNATLTATMALLQKQTADATGQFAKEAGSAAGAQEIANAKMQDAGAKIGAFFLPAMTAAATILGQVADFAAQNGTALAVMAVVIGTVAGAILAINTALAVWRAAVIAATAVQAAWNVAMSANPIGIIIVAVAAFVAGLIWAYQNVGWFKDFVDAAFKIIGDIIGNVVKFFQDAWNFAVKAVEIYIKTWMTIFRAIFTTVQTIVQNVAKFFQNAWNIAVKAVQIYINFWVTVIRTAFQIAQNVVANVANFLRSAWSAAFHFVSGIVSSVVAGIRSTIQTVITTAQNVVAFIRGGLAAAFEWISGVGSGAFQGIIAAIQGVIGWIQDAINWVGQLFGATSNAKANASGLGGATTAAGYLMRPTVDLAGVGGATGMFSAPSVFSAPRVQAPPQVFINVKVEGALDPIAVGTQVEGILRKSLRRSGVIANGAQPW